MCSSSLSLVTSSLACNPSLCLSCTQYTYFTILHILFPQSLILFVSFPLVCSPTFHFSYLRALPYSLFPVLTLSLSTVRYTVIPSCFFSFFFSVILYLLCPFFLYQLLSFPHSRFSSARAFSLVSSMQMLFPLVCALSPLPYSQC